MLPQSHNKVISRLQEGQLSLKLVKISYFWLVVGDKGDLTKKFDQVRVWCRWKGYLSGSMENGCWGVASGGMGRQRSF